MNTSGRSKDEDIGAVEVEAAATRQRVGEDLQALGDKLTPENLKEGIKSEAKEAMVHVKDTAMEKVSDVKESVQDAGRATLDFAGRNRVPLALIGAGLGWLIASRGRGNGHLRRRARTVFSGETYEGGYERTPVRRERTPVRRAEEWMHEGVERTRHLSDQAGETASRMGRRSREFARESPLAVGALSLAAGLGVGLALPTTRKEEELLGPAHDRLVGQARGTAEEVGQTVKGTAREIKQKLSEPMTH